MKVSAFKLITKHVKALAAFINSIPDGIIIYDQDANIIETNQYAKELNELINDSEYLKLNLAQRVKKAKLYKTNGDLLQLEMTSIYRALTFGETIYNFEYIKKHDDDKNQYISVSCAPLKDKEGNICGAISVKKDITPMKINELALEENYRYTQDLVQKLREEDQNKLIFLNMLSHELRNPLASIMMGLSLMEKVTPGEEKDKQAREIIKRQASQLQHLVDDLLDITRINNNKIILKKESVELNQLINKTVNDHKQQFINKGIDLDLDISSSTKLFVDPVRITQTISNLLNNAEKFSRPGDRAHVKVSLEGDNVIIVVSDTGAGVSPDLLPYLFEPFVQEERTLARSQGGLGLGLAISKGIVELHGGTIIAESEGIGCGTTFKISLPLMSE